MGWLMLLSARTPQWFSFPHELSRITRVPSDVQPILDWMKALTADLLRQELDHPSPYAPAPYTHCVLSYAENGTLYEEFLRALWPSWLAGSMELLGEGWVLAKLTSSQAKQLRLAQTKLMAPSIVDYFRDTVVTRGAISTSTALLATELHRQNSPWGLAHALRVAQCALTDAPGPALLLARA